MRVVLFALGSMPVPLIPRTRWLNIFSRARVLTAVGEIAVRTVRRNEFLVIVTSERDAFQDRVQRGLRAVEPDRRMPGIHVPVGIGHALDERSLFDRFLALVAVAIDADLSLTRIGNTGATREYRGQHKRR